MKKIVIFLLLTLVFACTSSITNPEHKPLNPNAGYWALQDSTESDNLTKDKD